MKKVLHQHGDLILYEVSEIPKGAKKLEVVPGFVLERGEGVHTHILEDVAGVEIYEKDGNFYVRVESKARINHEEHGIQTLGPAIHEKGIEQVWDYETEEARRTID